MEGALGASNAWDTRMATARRRTVWVALLATACALGCDKKPTQPYSTPHSGCSISPENVSFGDVVVSSFKDTTMTITNTGTTQLASVLIVSQQGSGFALVGSSAINLDPGRSSTFTIRFQPGSTGQFSCTIAT